jgi:ankyrin repeat protein
VATKRNHKDVVEYLLRQGADPNVSTPAGLTILEHAILPGYYEVALMLYDQVKQKELRSPQEYQDLAGTYNGRYVDYEIFLENLQKKTPLENVPNFLTRPVRVYRDPVVDPRESWGQWMRRQLDFKDPPLVERDELPEELQPQNRRFGKLNTMVSNFAMSPMVPRKPSFRPSKSSAVVSENELKSAPETNSELKPHTVA